jgi:hypothetical protein
VALGSIDGEEMTTLNRAIKKWYNTLQQGSPLVSCIITLDDYETIDIFAESEEAQEIMLEVLEEIQRNRNAS